MAVGSNLAIDSTDPNDPFAQIRRQASLAIVPPPSLAISPNPAPSSNLAIGPAPEKAPDISAFTRPQPTVQAPRGTVEGDQARRTELLSHPAALENVYHDISHSDFGQNHPVLGKILGGLAQVPATALDVGLSGVVPRLGGLIPGTSIQRGERIQSANQAVTQDEAEREKEAQTESQRAETGLHEAQTEAARLIDISPEEAQAMGNPSLAGQSVTQGVYQHLLTNAGTNTARRDVANINATSREDVATINARVKEEVQRLKPEQRDDRAIRILSTPEAQRTQDDNAYLSAYDKWIQQTKVQPGIARAVAFESFHPVQVIDPSTNQAIYMQAGEAERGRFGTPQSMDFRTAVSLQKAFTSGPQAAQLTAFRTATDHLQLLKEYSAALNNGDTQMINRLSNEFKTQFGQAAPTNAQALAEMLSGELAQIMSKNGATVSEIGEMRKQVNTNAQSPDQITGIIETNQNAINEKANEMLQQYTQGMQGGGPVFQPLSAGGTNPTNLPRTPARGGGETQKFTLNGRTYNIPKDKVTEFKKDHPDAR